MVRSTWLWARQLLLGVAMVSLGLAVAYWGRGYPAAAAGGLLVVALGVAALRRAERRAHGKQVERRAQLRLKLPPTWYVEFNRLLPEGGDLDVYAVSPQRQGYAIEIKSLEGVRIKRSLFRGAEALVHLDGSSLKRDPVAQILKAAAAVGATPVIWLPNAPARRPLQMRCGVLVVQGPPKRLRVAIGAELSWWFSL